LAKANPLRAVVSTVIVKEPDEVMIDANENLRACPTTEATCPIGGAVAVSGRSVEEPAGRFE